MDKTNEIHDTYICWGLEYLEVFIQKATGITMARVMIKDKYTFLVTSVCVIWYQDTLDVRLKAAQTQLVNEQTDFATYFILFVPHWK